MERIAESRDCVITHYFREAGAGGSNPLSPTTITHWKQWVFSYLAPTHASFELR